MKGFIVGLCVVLILFIVIFAFHGNNANLSTKYAIQLKKTAQKKNGENMEKKTNYKNCYLFVLETMADWEIGFITSELNSGRYLDHSNGEFRLIKIGNTLQPVTTMGGIIITPDKDLGDVKFEEGDLLILPGAETWMNGENRRILDIAGELINKKITIAAICGASIALAQKGLLNNRKHTSNDKDYLKMVCPGYAGADYYINQPAVADGNLITASGVGQLEFSYEIFKSIGAMREKTLEAWYQLYKTKESKYFFDLMESMK